MYKYPSSVLHASLYGMYNDFGSELSDIARTNSSQYSNNEYTEVIVRQRETQAKYAASSVRAIERSYICFMLEYKIKWFQTNFRRRQKVSEGDGDHRTTEKFQLENDSACHVCVET